MSTTYELRNGEFLSFCDRMKVEGKHITRLEVVGTTGYKATVEAIKPCNASEQRMLLDVAELAENYPDTTSEATLTAAGG